MAVTEECVGQQCSERGRKDDGVGQTSMPQQMLRGHPELETNHIQVWNDRAGYTSEQHGG